jgi:hypothetical protein
LTPSPSPSPSPSLLQLSAPITNTERTDSERRPPREPRSNEIASTMQRRLRTLRQIRSAREHDFAHLITSQRAVVTSARFKFSQISIERVHHS